MFQIISGTSKTVSGTQNLERNVPTTAHKNVPTNSRLLGTLFQLAFPVHLESPSIVALFGRCDPALSGQTSAEHHTAFSAVSVLIRDIILSFST